MIGSCCIMRAEGMIEGTDTSTEKTGAKLNLKTKGLNVRGMEINLVERGKRHLHILSGIVEMFRFGFKVLF